MQADIDISESDVFCVKECVVDGVHAHLTIITKDTVVRLLMSVGLMRQAINYIDLTLPENCKPVENVSNADTSRKFDMTLKAVDLRVGGPTGFRGPSVPEIRFYTGKRRKHCVHMKLSWGQLALMRDLMAGLQETLQPSTAVA